MQPETLMESTATAVINTPVADVDLTDWLFHLGDTEYQRCAPGEHIAAGTTTTDDGRPMSINVEHVGDALLIQHYVGEITTAHHLRLVSETDSFTPLGRTRIGVIWELTVTADGADRCVFTNRVAVLPTADYAELLRQHAISLDDAATAGQPALDRHNSVETPLYALSIERRARTAEPRLT